VTRGGEARRLAHEARKRGGREHADAGHGAEQLYLGQLAAHALDPSGERLRLLAEAFDFVERDLELLAQIDGQTLVIEDDAGLLDDRVGALRKRVAEFAQDPAHGVDPPCTVCDVGRAQTMQRGESLLLDRLHRHVVDPLVAARLQERDRVRPVRLVAVPVAGHVARRQQPYPMPHRLELAAPVVRRPARFHQDLRRLAFREEALEPLPAQPTMLIHPPGRR